MTLLDAAIDAHGGAARWASLRELRAHLRSGGLAYPLRRRPSPVDLRLRVSCHEPRNVLEDWPAPGRRGVMTAERVWIEDAGGAVVAEREHPRRLFRALSRRAVRWDDLDFLYFAGYASWNYLTTPWLLASEGVRVRELPGRRLHATFPPAIPTHSREQVFHFDADARLVRLDYTAEVFGGWARAVHRCHDHRDFDGLLAPTRRRVTPRAAGRPLPAPTLIWIELLALRGEPAA